MLQCTYLSHICVSLSTGVFDSCNRSGMFPCALRWGFGPWGPFVRRVSGVWRVSSSIWSPPVPHRSESRVRSLTRPSQTDSEERSSALSLERRTLLRHTEEVKVKVTCAYIHFKSNMSADQSAAQQAKWHITLQIH